MAQLRSHHALTMADRGLFEPPPFPATALRDCQTALRVLFHGKCSFCLL
jgi:hypothetical protein